MRYTTTEHDTFARDFNRDRLVVLKNHNPREKLRRRAAEFLTLMAAQIDREKEISSCGAHRDYVTLPFKGLFADPAIYEDPDLLTIVGRVAKPEPVQYQLASDTSPKGSGYQPWHADTPLQFPEWQNNDTPSFQLAVNFALCDVGDDNGAFETILGTQRMNKENAVTGMTSGTIAWQRFSVPMGDVMVRDVQTVHRGTPNTTDRPRPMVAPGYSRRWHFRPEVEIRMLQNNLNKLRTGRSLLRFNPVVPDGEATGAPEKHRSFAY